MENKYFTRKLAALRLNESLTYAGDKTLDDMKFEFDRILQEKNDEIKKLKTSDFSTEIEKLWELATDVNNKRINGGQLILEIEKLHKKYCY